MQVDRLVARTILEARTVDRRVDAGRVQVDGLGQALGVEVVREVEVVEDRCPGHAHAHERVGDATRVHGEGHVEGVEVRVLEPQLEPVLGGRRGVRQDGQDLARLHVTGDRDERGAGGDGLGGRAERERGDHGRDQQRAEGKRAKSTGHGHREDS